MSFPAAAQQALAKLRQGPLAVVFDPYGTPVSLFVNGGLDTTFARGVEEARVDIIGLYDMYTSGDSADFELELPEQSLEVLNVIFPEGASGTYSGKTYRGFGRSAGYSLRSNAQACRMRPWELRDETDPADVQVNFWLVAPNGPATLRQGVDAPHTWNQPFIAFPQLTRADGELIARIYAQARS